jgi:putative peptide zinc metalloprotease protein
VVGVLAAPLTPLFAPAAFWPGFALAATAAIWAAALMTWNASRLMADVVAPPVLGLFVLSTLLHELGHAAATRRGGGEPGEIGFGIYLFFPVLYTSVDACWRLPRQNRIIVDLGGVYLQLLMALILIAGGMLWPEFADTARAAFLAIAASVIISAHPFLRLDGYWVIADAFGLVNLRRQSLEALRNAAARLRDPRAPRRPPSLAQADARVVAAVLGYGVLSILFFGYLALAIGRTYPAYATNVYPGLLRLELSRLAAGLAGFEPLTIFSALVNLAAPTALVVGVPLLLVRPAVRFLAGRNWRGRAASPAGRAPGGSR